MFDFASEYMFFLDGDKEKAMRLGLLLCFLEKYVNGATIEMKRLNRVRRSQKRKLADIISGGEMKKDFDSTYHFVDTQFYFVCIDKIDRLLVALGEELNDSDIKKLADQMKSIFHIREVRNHLEHIDERLRGFLKDGDKKKGIKTKITDLGNFWGDDFSFAGKRTPSGADSLVALKKIYTELIDILHQKYAMKNADFISRQQRNRYIEVVKKRIEQELQNSGFL